MPSDVTVQGMKPVTHRNTIVLRWILLLAAACLVIEVLRLNGAGSASGDLGALRKQVDELSSDNQALRKQLEAVQAASEAAEKDAQAAQSTGNSALGSAQAAQSAVDATNEKIDRLLGGNKGLSLRGPGQSHIDLGFLDSGAFLSLYDADGEMRATLSPGVNDKQIYTGSYCLFLSHAKGKAGGQAWSRCDTSTN